MTHVSVRRGLLYVSIAATAWGTGGAAGALLYRAGGLGPVAVTFWRFAIGAAILLATARLPGRSPGRLPGPGRRSGLGRIVVTGVAMAVYQTAYFAAIAASGLAVATVVTMGATAVLVAAGAHLLLRERLGPAGVSAVAASLTGLTALTPAGGAAAFSMAGLGWALLSAAGYAGVTLLNRALNRADRAPGRARDRTLGRGSLGEPYATAAGGFVVGGLCLLPPALAQGLLPEGDPLVSWALIVYLGGVPTALAYGLFFIGLGAVRATTATVISLVEPVGAAVIGVLLLGERLTPQAVCGGALLLAAVGLLALGERRDTPPPV
ncbi:membrane protein [Streptosporangium violaceochromogenes]|nr:membrane protein [Streptosporangium violaceochromogenes]